LDDDARLGCRLATGEPEAFEQTYDLYGPGLFRFALRMLNSAADAEDAVQEVFAALAAGRRHADYPPRFVDYSKKLSMVISPFQVG